MAIRLLMGFDGSPAASAAVGVGATLFPRRARLDLPSLDAAVRQRGDAAAAVDRHPKRQSVVEAIEREG